MSKSHVLTISIPTYNRSKFLMETLGNIRDQMTNDCLEDDIAIHVNDNCSPDSTGNDVALFRKNNPKIKMTYARNKSNLGADRNIDLAAK
ncbi:MAG: glycosyltransferase, partial [Candidatus Micrarchaeia archaeon]